MPHIAHLLTHQSLTPVWRASWCLYVICSEIPSSHNANVRLIVCADQGSAACRRTGASANGRKSNGRQKWKRFKRARPCKALARQLEIHLLRSGNTFMVTKIVYTSTCAGKTKARILARRASRLQARLILNESSSSRVQMLYRDRIEYRLT